VKWPSGGDVKVVDRMSMLLRQKGSDIYSVRSDASVYSAIELMADKGIGALLVIDDGQLVGVLSERDYARKVILQGKSSKDTFIREIMTSSPISIRLDTSVEEAMRIMTEHRIRHLPVIDSEGKVAGVMSLGDLVKWIIMSQDHEIKQMEHYIAGGQYQ
jgi:CBS domain-containing protein